MNESNPDLNRPTADLVHQLAHEAAKPEILKIKLKGLGAGLPEEVPIVWDSKEQQLVSLSSEIQRFRLAPERRTGTALVTTLQSFVDLTNRHKDQHSALFGRTAWPEPKLTAVLDYHQTDGVARHGSHRIVYEFPVTEELKAWVGGNGQPLGQGEFAAFLEEHAAELSAPTEEESKFYEPLFKVRFASPNELITLSRQLQIHVNSHFKQGEVLQSGERTVEFREEHSDANGETVDIPGLFMVSVPAFLDGAPVRIPARLRYRAGRGEVVWFYQLYRWECFLRDRVQADLAQAAADTDLPSFEGSPERG